MKHKLLSLSLLMLFVSTVMFTGCSKDEETTPVAKAAPSVTISGATGSSDSEKGYFSAGSSVVIAYSVTTGEDLSKVVITEVIGTTTTPKETKTTGFTTTTSHSGNYTYAVSSTAAAGSSITIKIEATDSKGAISYDSYVIMIPGQVTPFTAVLLGAQSNSNPSCLNAQTGVTAGITAAASLPSGVDIIYFYGSSNKATLSTASDTDLQSVYPSVASWSTKNTTTFVKSTLTATQFDAVADDRDFAGITSTATKANMLAVGDVYVFKTTAGKKGLVKVKSISAADATGTITLDLKVQK